MEKQASSKFRYKKLFIYSSPQFSGNMEEFFSKNTEKLVVFIIMPDARKGFNLVRLYKKGKLVEEKKVWTSPNKILYYASWYFGQIYCMLRYFSRNEPFILIGGHPISFFGMTLQKLLRKVTFVFMIGDYFPEVTFMLRLFHKLKKYYHDRIPYAFYLSDPVNKIMNGEVASSNNRKTIMWGLNPRKIKRDFKKVQFSLLFVGLVKNFQGIELLFDFLRAHKNYTLKIIGITHGNLYEHYQTMMKKYGIEKQVFYPNKFFSTKDLDDISRQCFVGVAPYRTGKQYGTYYVDVGKVKAYTEMQLPVIMTNTSGIVSHIKKFHAGEIIDENTESFYDGVVKIKKNYKSYLLGVEKFNKYFYFQTYYAEKFAFLEKM